MFVSVISVDCHQVHGINHDDDVAVAFDIIHKRAKGEFTSRTKNNYLSRDPPPTSTTEHVTMSVSSTAAVSSTDNSLMAGDPVVVNEPPFIGAQSPKRKRRPTTTTTTTTTTTDNNNNNSSNNDAGQHPSFQNLLLVCRALRVFADANDVSWLSRLAALRYVAHPTHRLANKIAVHIGLFVEMLRCHNETMSIADMDFVSVFAALFGPENITKMQRGLCPSFFAVRKIDNAETAYQQAIVFIRNAVFDNVMLGVQPLSLTPRNDETIPSLVNHPGLHFSSTRALGFGGYDLTAIELLCTKKDPLTGLPLIVVDEPELFYATFSRPLAKEIAHARQRDECFISGDGALSCETPQSWQSIAEMATLTIPRIGGGAHNVVHPLQLCLVVSSAGDVLSHPFVEQCKTSSRSCDHITTI